MAVFGVGALLAGFWTVFGCVPVPLRRAIWAWVAGVVGMEIKILDGHILRVYDCLAFMILEEITRRLL
jgi:hypothetical protein